MNKPVILTRKPSDSHSLASKSLEQREEDYAKARARIFNGFESNNNSQTDCDLESSTNNSTNPSSSPPNTHSHSTDSLLPQHFSNPSSSPISPSNEHPPQKTDSKTTPTSSPAPSPTGSFNKRPFLDEPTSNDTHHDPKYQKKEIQMEANEDSQQKQVFNNLSPNPSPVHSPTTVDRVAKNFKNQLKLSGSESHELFNRNVNNQNIPSSSNFWKRDAFEDSLPPDPSNFSTWHPPLSSAFTPNNFQPRNIPPHREQEEYSHRSYSDSNIIRPNTFIPSDQLHGNINYPPPGPPIRWTGAIPDSTPHWGPVPTFPSGPVRNDFPPPGGPYSPGSKLPPPHEHFPPPGPRDPFNNFNPPPPSHDRNFFYPPQQRNTDFPPPPVYVYPWSNPTQPRYTHDYDRPKPKSTQLYDPNAPQDNFNIHPHSPVPISPTFIHPPFEPQYSRPLNEPIPLGRSAPRYPKHPNLLYDYTQQTFVTSPTTCTPPTTPTSPTPVTIPHILELKNLPENISLQDGRLEPLKKAGATVKVLEDKNIVLAIFKNAAVAKNALETITSDLFELIVYKAK